MSGESKDSFKVGLVQANPVVGDIEGNLNKAKSLRVALGAEGARSHRLYGTLSHGLSA